MDALCHSVDSLLNINNTKESEDLSIESISLICKYLQLLINDLNNETTRFKLLEASNLAGRAITITKTALNHAISYPLTNLYGIQHGFACCFSVIATFEKYEKNLNQLSYSKILKDVRNLIENLYQRGLININAEIIDINKVSSLISKNSRLANFIFDINEDDITDILNRSKFYYQIVEFLFFI